MIQSNQGVYRRPALHREDYRTQQVRNGRELDKAAERHTLSVTKRITEWLDVQKELGTTFEEADLLTEVESQCRRHGVRTEHIPVARDLIRDIYFGR